MNKEHSISRRIFIGLMALHAFVAIGLGSTSLINFPYALETGFGITYSPDLDVFGILIGLQLLLLGAWSILSILWTNRRKAAGVVVGIFVGTYIFAFGVMAFAKFGDPQPLYVDSIRGFLTVVIGMLAYRDLQGRKNHG